MNKQFTPGAWKVSKKCKMLGQPENPLAFEISAEGNVWWIAQVQASAIEPYICEANARLIAAAPEMFKALENAADMLLHSEYSEYAEEIKSLLTKITTP